MFLVVSQSNVHFGFEHPFLRAQSGAQVKMLIPKVGVPSEKFVHP